MQDKEFAPPPNSVEEFYQAEKTLIEQMRSLVPSYSETEALLMSTMINRVEPQPVMMHPKPSDISHLERMYISMPGTLERLRYLDGRMSMPIRSGITLSRNSRRLSPATFAAIAAMASMDNYFTEYDTHEERCTCKRFDGSACARHRRLPTACCACACHKAHHVNRSKSKRKKK